MYVFSVSMFGGAKRLCTRALLVAFFTGTPVAVADISGRVDKLDPSDGFPMPPNNLVVVDLFVDADAQNPWLATGIEWLAARENGARIAFPRDSQNAPIFASSAEFVGEFGRKLAGSGWQTAGFRARMDQNISAPYSACEGDRHRGPKNLVFRYAACSPL